MPFIIAVGQMGLMLGAIGLVLAFAVKRSERRNREDKSRATKNQNL